MQDWRNLHNLRLTTILLMIWVLVDLAYSFYQFLALPLDGDLAPIVLPSGHYRRVLEDPLGVSALISGEAYAGVNRYFAHASMWVWFHNLPGGLQRFVTPVSSLYAAAALAKLLMQILLLWTMARIITRLTGEQKAFWPALALLAPFFQVNGYHGALGLIEGSVTYSFFYSLPAGLLLLYFLWLLKGCAGGDPQPMGGWRHAGLGFLALALAFSGPLAPAILLLIGTMAVAARLLGKQIGPAEVWLHLGLASALSLYSLYLGTYNAEAPALSPPLPERYGLMLRGLAGLFSTKLGLPLLSVSLILLWFRLRRMDERFAKNWMRWMRYFLLFAALYLALLPLGGYRAYRPLLVRNDTFMPIALGLILLYVAAAVWLLLRHRRPAAGIGIAIMALIFTLADGYAQKNTCEKAALQAMAQADTQVLLLDTDCPVLSWTPVQDTLLSYDNARMLHQWGITKSVVLYRNR